MTVSVTVVRSAPTGTTTAAVNAANLASNGAARDGATTIIPSSAERPLPAAPRATETAVAIPMPAEADSASSVMMVTINY